LIGNFSALIFDPTMNTDTNQQEEQVYTPNHIPASERASSIIFSSILLIYGIIGFAIDDLYIPGKHSKGVHLHGESMWIMLGSFALAIANLMSVVVDHYDKRNNETNYRLFAKVTKIAAWVVFILALVLDLAVFHRTYK
jgi:hypothetical protein